MMFKKGLAYFLAVLMIAGLIGFSTTALAASPTLTLNGTKINATIFTKSKLPMFPIRLICEQLGYTYSYKSGKATITTNDDVLKMTKGSSYYYDGDNTKVKLGTYPVLKYSMLYVPATFFTDMMGMDYSVDSAGNYTLKTATAVVPSSAPSATVTAAPSPTAAVLGNIYLNDKQISGNAYLNAQSKLFVPLDAIVQAFGGTILMSGTTAIITVSGSMAYVDPKQPMYQWNGQNYYLSTLPEVSNNVIYVPIEFIEKVFSSTYLYRDNVLKIYSTTGIAQSEFNVKVNTLLLSVKGYYNIAGKTMLPVKPLGEALGFTVTAEGATIKLVRGTTTISFVPGQTTYYSDNWTSKTYAASETRNNEIFIPIEMATDLMGVTSSNMVMGELVLNTTGVSSGGVPIKINRNGSYVDTGLYAKPSGNNILIPINTLLDDFGYTMNISGSYVYLTKKTTSHADVANIQFSPGSTVVQLSGSAKTTINGQHIAAAAPEMSGTTVYLSMDIISIATGLNYTGSLITEVKIG